MSAEVNLTELNAHLARMVRELVTVEQSRPGTIDEVCVAAHEQFRKWQERHPRQGEGE